MDGTRTATTKGGGPPNARIVLGSLILVAAVANLNLSVANVALPSIGASFDSSQTMLDLIAVGYSLGLAASVLWFGALGDRYGRKLLMLLGMGCRSRSRWWPRSRPRTRCCSARASSAACRPAWPTRRRSPSSRRCGRVLHGPGRSRCGPRSGAASRCSARSSPASCSLYFAWGSVFLVTLPLAVVALYMAWKHVPAHVNEATEPVDNLGGVLSAIMIGALVVGLNFITVPNLQTLAVGLFVVAVIGRGAVRPSPEARSEPAVRPQGGRPARPSGWRPAPASSSSAR